MKPTSDQLRAWGKLGGRAKGGVKGKASRANGKLGGRPKKNEVRIKIGNMPINVTP